MGVIPARNGVYRVDRQYLVASAANMPGSVPAEHIAPPRRMRRKAAAKYLGVSEGFLEKAAVRGGGPPYIRLSARLVLYERSDLDGWAAARRVANTAEAVERDRRNFA